MTETSNAREGGREKIETVRGKTRAGLDRLKEQMKPPESDEKSRKEGGAGRNEAANENTVLDLTEQEKQKQKDLLREYCQPGLLDKITHGEIMKMQKNGTLHILLLAMSFHSTDVSDSAADKMMETMWNETGEIRREIGNKITAEDARTELAQEPFAGYFKQEQEWEVGIKIDQLTDAQVLTLYKICLLERQVRKAEIGYEADAPFWHSLYAKVELTKDGETVRRRRGDCDSVAAYYFVLASAANAPELVASMYSVTLQEHGQIGFDLGPDNKGSRIRFVKNTSHVDMSSVRDGKQKDSGRPPYAHNFGSLTYDLDEYGEAEKTAMTPGPVATVASLVRDMNEAGDIRGVTDKAKLNNRLRFSEKILSLNPYDATENENCLRVLFHAVKEGILPKEEIQERAGRVLERYIEVCYWSGFSLGKFIDLFGKEVAQSHIDKYAQKIERDPKSFTDFVARSQVTVGNLSLAVINRFNMLKLLGGGKVFTAESAAGKLCAEQCDKLYKKAKGQ